MATREEMLLEAEKRGILPEKYKAELTQLKAGSNVKKIGRSMGDWKKAAEPYVKAGAEATAGTLASPLYAFDRNKGIQVNRPVLEMGGMAAGEALGGGPITANVGGGVGYAAGRQAADLLEHVGGSKEPYTLKGQAEKAAIDVPAGMAMGAAGKIGEKAISWGLGKVAAMAPRIYEKMIKMPSNMSRLAIGKVTSTALREGIPVTEGGLEQLQATTKEIQSQVNSIIEQGTKSGKGVSARKVISYLDDARKKYANNPLSEEYIKDVDLLEAKLRAKYIEDTNPEARFAEGNETAEAKAFKANRNKIKFDSEADMEGYPEYQADRDLSKRLGPNYRSIAQKFVTTDKITPEQLRVFHDVAGTYGLGEGEELARTMADLPTREKTLKAMIDSRMGREYGKTELPIEPAKVGNDLIPVKEAQKIKQATYKMLRGHYEKAAKGVPGGKDPEGGEVQGLEAFARGLKEQIVEQFPVLKNLNYRDGAMLDLEKYLTKAVNRIHKRELGGIALDFAAPVIGGAAGGYEGRKGGAGGVLGGIGGGAALGMGVTRAMRNPAFMSKLAFAMKKAAKLADNPGIGTLTKSAAYGVGKIGILDPAMQAAAAENPGSEMTAAKRGIEFYTANNWDDAIREWRHALKEEPGRAKEIIGWINRALAEKKGASEIMKRRGQQPQQVASL